MACPLQYVWLFHRGRQTGVQPTSPLTQAHVIGTSVTYVRRHICVAVIQVPEAIIVCVGYKSTVLGEQTRMIRRYARRPFSPSRAMNHFHRSNHGGAASQFTATRPRFQLHQERASPGADSLTQYPDRPTTGIPAGLGPLRSES